MREEPLAITQERTLALNAPKLLEEGESDDLGIGEVFERFVASSVVGVEVGVGAVYEAEEHGQSLFQVASEWVCWG